MNRDFEISAVIIIAVFGALSIGGLMAAALVWSDRPGFLLALGASVVAWAAGYAMVFQKPDAFRWLVIAAVALAVGATASLVT